MVRAYVHPPKAGFFVKNMRSLEGLRTIYPTHSFADLHIHTTEYDGIMTPQEVVDEAVRKGLDVIAVTEHDSVKAGLKAEQYAIETEKPVTVIPAVEISSKNGHIIGIGVRKDIPRGRSAEDTIRAIHDQGDEDQALAIVAHPTHRWAHSLSERDVLRLREHPDAHARYDAIEAATPWHREVPLIKTGDKSASLYKKHGADVLGPAVVSSDAHGRVLGKGVTIFHRDTTLFEAIRSGKVHGEITTVEDSKSKRETLEFFALCVYWWLIRDPRQQVEAYFREKRLAPIPIRI